MKVKKPAGWRFGELSRGGINAAVWGKASRGCHLAVARQLPESIVHFRFRGHEGRRGRQRHLHSLWAHRRHELHTRCGRVRSLLRRHLRRHRQRSLELRSMRKCLSQRRDLPRQHLRARRSAGDVFRRRLPRRSGLRGWLLLRNALLPSRRSGRLVRALGHGQRGRNMLRRRLRQRGCGRSELRSLWEILQRRRLLRSRTLPAESCLRELERRPGLSPHRDQHRWLLRLELPGSRQRSPQLRSMRRGVPHRRHLLGRRLRFTRWWPRGVWRRGGVLSHQHGVRGPRLSLSSMPRGRERRALWH